MSEQITITLTKEQAEAIKTHYAQSNLMWNTAAFYAEIFNYIDDDTSLSLSGAIVLSKTFNDASDYIREGDEVLSPIFQQLSREIV